MSATISSMTPPLSATPPHSRKKLLRQPRNRQQTNTAKQLETLSQSPITKTSTRTPTTSLTTRMRQKQHKLQALRGSAEKFPSQIPNLVEASPATPPTWRHSHSSPDGESTKYPSKLTRYDYSRSPSADFDGRRYRALQREMTRAATTSRDFLPPKRLQLLSSLPSQALSPQATKALRQLAKEIQATPPPLTLKRRRLVLEPLVPTTPTGFLDVQEHQVPPQDRGVAEQTLSLLHMWVATATLHTSLVLYVYLLMLVFGMLLCCSDNPCQETVRGYQALGAGIYGVATTIQEEIRWRELRGHSVGIWHESVVWGQHTMITIETIVSTHLWRLQTSSDVMLEGSHHLAPVQREAMHSAQTEEKGSLRNDMSLHHNTIDQSVGILDSGDNEADACHCQNDVVDLLAGRWDRQIMTTPLLNTSTVGVPTLAKEPGEQQEFSGDDNWWAAIQSDERIRHISELIHGANFITLAFGT